MSSVLWIVPEKSGGIRSYAETLLPHFGSDVKAIWTLPNPAQFKNEPSPLIHIQHEYGLFGSKLPGLYQFPKWIRSARRASPEKKWIATAHTVLDKEWKYRTQGRGWRGTPLALLNSTLVPAMRKNWLEGTWGHLDGVIVHSEFQAKVIMDSGCKTVAVIPHFVPMARERKAINPKNEPTVVLFGYFSPEKGQDLAISAWRILGARAPRLVLAGGVRRPEDQWYFDKAVRDIRRFGLTDKIEITGFVPSENLPALYDRATFVLAPFRETSGSGSLATALGFGAPILASDLVLNREITARVSDSLALFSAGSPESLAAEVICLLKDESRRMTLSKRANAYALAYSPQKISQMYREFYRKMIGDFPA